MTLLVFHLRTTSKENRKQTDSDHKIGERKITGPTLFPVSIASGMHSSQFRQAD